MISFKSNSLPTNHAAKQVSGLKDEDAGSKFNSAAELQKLAEVDTKPQLEIYADDVKCSHGATLGQMNEDEVFYFLARAIPESKAREMIAIGFAQDSMRHLRSQQVKEYLVSEFRTYFHTKG